MRVALNAGGRLPSSLKQGTSGPAATIGLCIVRRIKVPCIGLLEDENLLVGSQSKLGTLHCIPSPSLPRRTAAPEAGL